MNPSHLRRGIVVVYFYSIAKVQLEIDFNPIVVVDRLFKVGVFYDEE